jgi:LysR family transcriptional regulator, glycine cleavage system transcriptional activator
MAAWNRNVSMRALRAFCAAAERGSFRLAADELFLTASAVSHQIKQLEEVLGMTLFSRKPRSLKLTDAGRALLHDLGPILEDLDIVIERNSRRQGRAPLKLSVQPLFASELLVPRLSKFLRAHADISISVETSDAEIGSVDRTADVTIRLFTTPPDNLNSDRLFDIRLIPVASPDFYDSVKVVAGRVTSTFPLIVHDARPKAWKQWQASSGIRVPRDAPTIRLDSMLSVQQAAEQGLGAALMPVQLCGAKFATGKLAAIFEHELKVEEAYYLICNGAESSYVSTFRDWVLHEFAQE